MYQIFLSTDNGNDVTSVYRVAIMLPLPWKPPNIEWCIKIHGKEKIEFCRANPSAVYSKVLVHLKKIWAFFFSPMVHESVAIFTKRTAKKKKIWYENSRLLKEWILLLENGSFRVPLYLVKRFKEVTHYHFI